MTTYLPKVAIVGRPNVGKSALFNRICKKRVAIVDEQEGITRDRLIVETELFGRPFIAVDTGGIDPRSKAEFNDLIKQQAELAISEADSLILVVDGKMEPTSLDLEIAAMLLKTKKKVVLAVNKIDSELHISRAAPFWSLGISDIVPVSAAQGWQIAELLEKALDGVQGKHESELKGPNVCIMGRPNVGKSTLVNTLLKDNRTLVSPIAGTTRDAIDIPFTFENEPFTLIDTAGIRRKKGEHEVVDKFAAIRTQEAIERSDVCLLMLDAQTGITEQEKRIANMIEEAGKGCILLFNKWDLVKGFRMESCLRGIEDEVKFLHHCPKIFISAKTGRNLDKIFPAVKEVEADAKLRIGTGQLNHFVEQAVQKVHPPMLQGRRLRIYYLTQVAIEPPKFILFVNSPKLMTGAYQRYLQNQFRQTWRFAGVPITFHFKKKSTRSRNHALA